jgi:hypothetical protein
MVAGPLGSAVERGHQVLDSWIEDYLTRRPHQAIAMQVPAQRIQAPTAAVTPSPVPSVQPGRPAPPARQRSPGGCRPAA